MFTHFDHLNIILGLFQHSRFNISMCMWQGAMGLDRLCTSESWVTCRISLTQSTIEDVHLSFSMIVLFQGFALIHRGHHNARKTVLTTAQKHRVACSTAAKLDWALSRRCNKHKLYFCFIHTHRSVTIGKIRKTVHSSNRTRSIDIHFVVYQAKFALCKKKINRHTINVCIHDPANSRLPATAV